METAREAEHAARDQERMQAVTSSISMARQLSVTATTGNLTKEKDGLISRIASFVSWLYEDVSSMLAFLVRIL
jgi:hypothetical protein